MKKRVNKKNIYLCNMKLNEKKCKETVIGFLKHQPTVVGPMQLNSQSLKEFPASKLLGLIIISQALFWNEHCDHVYNKALERLYALRSLRKAGLNCADLVLVYCSLVRSIIDCASPVWAVLPAYLEDLLESIQRKALRIIFGKIECADAMAKASVDI